MAALSWREGRERQLMTATLRRQEPLQLARQRAKVVEFVFPDDKNSPAPSTQFGADGRVACLVTQKFRLPILNSRLGQPSSAATGMHVPETSVNEYNLRLLGKHNIRASWQIGSMEPVAEPGSMKKTSNLALRLSVLALNAPHILASAIWRYIIHVLCAYRSGGKSWQCDGVRRRA
jgi:hypothetical protein